MIPPTVDVRRASAKPVTVDLDQPLPDIPLDGHDHLYVTAFSCGVPLGTTVIPAPIDPFPGVLLADGLTRFARAVYHQRLKARFGPLRTAAPLPPASAIISTRGRADELRRCLAAIRELEHPPIEVLVVDSGGQDDATRAVAMEAGATYLVEPLRGKSRAHNRALAVARGEIVLFADDDVLVDRSWSKELLACFEDPLVMMASGLVLPSRLDTEARWLCERYSFLSRGFTARTLDGSRCSPLAAPTVLLGGSMAARRGFLFAVGGFPEELGPGMPLSGAGEEGYVGYRALRAGFRVAYEPRAVAWHLHRADRRDLRAAARDYAASSITYSLHMVRGNRDVVGITGALKTLHDIWGHVRFPFLARPWGRPLDLVLAELWGVVRAPISYVLSRRAVRRRRALVASPTEPFAPWIDDWARDRREGRAPAPLPKISVVIATLGQRVSLLTLLRALEDQAYPSDLVEVIVSVDGNGTALPEKIRAAGLRRQPEIVMAPRGGAGAARNRGAAVASGDVVLFLDDDVLPTHDELLDEHARQHSSGPPACVVGLVLPDGRPQTLRVAQDQRNWWVDSARRLRDHPRVFTDVVTGHLSMPRQLLSDFGGFFTAMYPGEDWELGYRLSSAGVPIRAAVGAAVVHDLSSEPPQDLEDRRREGKAHVAFVRRHPAAYWNLPLVHWEDMSARGRRTVRLLLAVRARMGSRDISPWVGGVLRWGEAMQRLLERSGMPIRSMTLLRALRLVSYWAAVVDAVGDEATWSAVLSRANEERTTSAVLDLAAPRWQDVDPRSTHVTIAVAATILGQAPISWGGVPWDRDVFARRVADHFGWPALITELSADLIA